MVPSYGPLPPLKGSEVWAHVATPRYVGRTNYRPCAYAGALEIRACFMLYVFFILHRFILMLAFVCTPLHGAELTNLRCREFSL